MATLLVLAPAAAGVALLALGRRGERIAGVVGVGGSLLSFACVVGLLAVGVGLWAVFEAMV